MNKNKDCYTKLLGDIYKLRGRLIDSLDCNDNTPLLDLKNDMIRLCDQIKIDLVKFEQISDIMILNDGILPCNENLIIDYISDDKLKELLNDLNIVIGNKISAKYGDNHDTKYTARKILGDMYKNKNYLNKISIIRDLSLTKDNSDNYIKELINHVIEIKNEIIKESNTKFSKEDNKLVYLCDTLINEINKNSMFTTQEIYNNKSDKVIFDCISQKIEKRLNSINYEDTYNKINKLFDTKIK